MAKCKSCGAPVFWAHTSNGTVIPLDADTMGRPLDSPEGNLQILGGEVVVVGQLERGVSRHISHFSTCPNAAQHRRKR